MARFRPIINNQYLILNELGSGGFTTVYKAWDNMLQKIVAIKKIHKEYSSDSKYIEMFQKEAINTAKLEHRNIVRVVNFVRDKEGGFYIVMDYVKGRSLRYLMNKCSADAIKLPTDICVYIISEVIKALDYAHNVKNELTNSPLNIIHRDLSPGNIMLYFDGRVKITDFGIARVGEEKQLTRNIDKKELKQKISYMSPEQAELKGGLDPRSDLFSCGSLFYEMLTGSVAFNAPTDVEVWQKVRKVEIDFDIMNKNDVPEVIQRIVKKVIQKSPEKRYQTAAEMFLDIKRYMSRQGRTEELMDKYKRFIKDYMKAEIEEHKKEMANDSQADFRGAFH